MKTFRKLVKNKFIFKRILNIYLRNTSEDHSSNFQAILLFPEGFKTNFENILFCYKMFKSVFKK